MWVVASQVLEICSHFLDLEDERKAWFGIFVQDLGLSEAGKAAAAAQARCPSFWHFVYHLRRERLLICLCSAPFLFVFLQGGERRPPEPAQAVGVRAHRRAAGEQGLPRRRRPEVRPQAARLRVPARTIYPGHRRCMTGLH